MSQLHIACAADARYVPHSAAMLHSAITRGGGPVVAHYLHGGEVSRRDRRALAVMCEQSGGEIAFHRIRDRRIAWLPVSDLFGPAMWYRILLAELLPDVPRLLYLDIDTIVVDRVAPLWELDLTGCYLGAVTNVFMAHHRHRPAELGLQATDYFNSGVLMLNLDLMRRDDFAGRVVERVGAGAGALLWPDQDALNLLAADRRVPLHPRWNCMNSLMADPAAAIAVFGQQAVAEALERPAIRHFEGPGANKPWHAQHDRSGQDLYRQHRLLTPWPAYELEGEAA